jgi:hypothetical protein
MPPFLFKLGVGAIIALFYLFEEIELPPDLSGGNNLFISWL